MPKLDNLKELADFFDVPILDLKGDKGEDAHTPTNEELIALITPLIPEPIKGEDGVDYVLTEKDKKEIASSIKVPVVEKVIEKIEVRTEVIREQPIVTEITKEVIPDELSFIVDSLRAEIGELKDELKREKPKSIVYGGIGIGTVQKFIATNAQSYAYRAITALRTLDASDYMIDCTTGTFSVTLPTAAGIKGRLYVIKNSGTGTITVDGSGAETIDGALTAVLNIQYGSITIHSTGSGWSII